jgi:hypothetical protein
MSNGMAAWMRMEKAALSPKSNIDLIRTIHFEAASLLAASIY